MRSAGRQRLADRSSVHGYFRGDTGDGPHRLAVVAELGVVVVLDDQPTGSGSSPIDQLTTAIRREHTTEWVLVGRRHDHHIGLDRAQASGVDPVVIDGDRNDSGPDGSDRVPLGVGAGVFDGDPDRSPGTRQFGDQQPQRGTHPGRDHHAGRIGTDGPDAGQVPGDHRPEFRRTLTIGVAELVDGHRVEGSVEAASPLSQGERRQVGESGLEVDPRRCLWGQGGRPVRHIRRVLQRRRHGVAATVDRA